MGEDLLMEWRRGSQVTLMGHAALMKVSLQSERPRSRSVPCTSTSVNLKIASSFRVKDPRSGLPTGLWIDVSSYASAGMCAHVSSSTALLSLHDWMTSAALSSGPGRSVDGL